MPIRNYYGENSFTFLLFDSLAQESARIPDLFLAQLQAFDRQAGWQKLRNRLIELQADSIQVWLFPSFGKRDGFGEPDAVVLAGEHTFWIETETHVDFVYRRTNARNSLRQLLRFRLLAAAIAAGSRVRGGERDRHMAFEGWTFRGDGTPRAAVIRLKGHKPLREMCQRIQQSFHARCDHYVLLSDGEPAHVSTHGRELLERTIDDHFEELAAVCREDAGEQARKHAEKPKLSQFWYTYWRGPLKTAFEEKSVQDPLSNGGYCRIRG